MFRPIRCYNNYINYSVAFQRLIFSKGYYKLTTKNYKFSDFELLNYKGLQMECLYIFFFLHRKKR